MQVSEREVYGRVMIPTALWLWAAQRFSGVLLGPLVLLHIWGVGASANRLLNGLLLLVILVHGYAGIRRIQMKAGSAGLLNAVAVLWIATVLGLGILTLLYPPR